MQKSLPNVVPADPRPENVVDEPEVNNISQISQPSFDSPLSRSLISSRIVPSVDHSVLDDLDVRPLSSLKSSFIDQPSEQDPLNVTVEETIEPFSVCLVCLIVGSQGLCPTRCCTIRSR